MEGQVSNVDMLKAPSSFRRFMEATNRTKKQQAKRERQRPFHKDSKFLMTSKICFFQV